MGTGSNRPNQPYLRLKYIGIDMLYAQENFKNVMENRLTVKKCQRGHNSAPVIGGEANSIYILIVLVVCVSTLSRALLTRRLFSTAD